MRDMVLQELSTVYLHREEGTWFTEWHSKLGNYH